MSQPHTAAMLGKFRKNRLCSYFQEGTCKSGSSCSFAHSRAEISSAPNLAKTKLCFQFFRQECHDDNCKFAHGYHELRSTDDVYKTQFCNGFRAGFCRFGSSCRFAHGEIKIGTDAINPMPPAPEDLPLPSGTLSKFVLARSLATQFIPKWNDEARAPSGIQSTCSSHQRQDAFTFVSQLPIVGDRSSVDLADPMRVGYPTRQPEMDQQFNTPPYDGLPLLTTAVERDTAPIRLERADYLHKAVLDFKEPHSEQAWFGGQLPAFTSQCHPLGLRKSP